MAKATGTKPIGRVPGGPKKKKPIKRVGGGPAKKKAAKKKAAKRK